MVVLMEALVNPYCNKKAHGIVSVSLSLAVSFERNLPDFHQQKKSEHALICLFIFYLLHNLFVLIHNAKIRKLFELLGNKKQYGDNLL